MLKKLDGKLKKAKGVYTFVTSEEVAEVVNKIKEVVNAYNWNGMTVCPYGYPVKIKDLIKNWDDFENYTTSSQSVMISEINGLIDILNAWLKYHEQSGWAVVDNGEIIFTGTEYQCDKTVLSMNNDELEVRYVGY